jgi:hypothetical protein
MKTYRIALISGDGIGDAAAAFSPPGWQGNLAAPTMAK